ncbi:MAG: DNA methyltransferase [Defluviicoccus sp.]
MLRPMLNNSARGDAVYEAFAGSGSTIIAAEKSGRRCFGMEIKVIDDLLPFERFLAAGGQTVDARRRHSATESANGSGQNNFFNTANAMSRLHALAGRSAGFGGARPLP